MASIEDGDWKVYVKTGKVATKETVVLVVYGDKNISVPFQLGKGGGELFQPSQEDEFKVKLLGIGEIYKIRIGLESGNHNGSWQLSQVKMKDMTTNEHLFFKFKNRMFSRNEDDGDMWRELPAVRPGKQPLPVHKYHVEVHTGTEPASDTDANVYLNIFGEKGDTGKRLLHRSNKEEKFQVGQIDVFELQAVTVLTPSKVIVGHDGKGAGAGWYLKQVIIKESSDAKTEYIFKCNRWLDEGQGDSAIERELELTEMKAIQANDWQIYVTTGSNSDSGTSSEVTLYAYGDKTVEDVVLLPDHGNGFQPGTTEDFRVNLGDIGTLYKIRIGHDNNQSEGSWYLKTVKMVDLFEGNELNFDFDRWLSREHDDLDTWRELPAFIPPKKPLPVTKYYVMLWTGSIEEAETNANVFMNIHGKYGDTGKRQLVKSKNNEQRFRSGQMDVFEIEAVRLGQISKAVLGHDGKSAGDGWFVEKVIIKESKAAKNEVYFACKKWFDVGKADKKIRRELLPGKPPSIPKPITQEEVEVGTTTVTVKWKKSAGELTGYSVKCMPANIENPIINIKNPSVTQAEFTGLTPGQEYSFDIISVNQDLEGDPVNISVTTARISEDTLKQLLLVMSKFYDGYEYINMLKVLYRDHITIAFNLDRATTTIHLLHLLIASGDLSRTDITILYDTIKATEQFGLEQQIKQLIPSCPNCKDIAISKFTLHRQKLMKLGMLLKQVDVANIGALYKNSIKEYADSWCLIMDLEDRGIIRVRKMGEFIGKLKTLQLPLAVEALKEDTPNAHSSYENGEDVTLTLSDNRKRKWDDVNDDPHQKDPLNLINQLIKYKNYLKVKDVKEVHVKCEQLNNYFKSLHLRVNSTEHGSIVFHLSVHDPNALMNLWEIHLSGELIIDLAEILVPEKLQQDFKDEWTTHIDELKYKAALSKLKGKVQCDSYDFCIISDDTEWENQLAEDLKQRRPNVNCTIMKKWRLSKPETIKLSIGESKKVIIGFSPKPYSKYAAHSVIVEMLEAKTLADAKLMPVKISKDAVVPPAFESFTVVNVWEEDFVDKLLQDLNECEKKDLATGSRDVDEEHDVGSGHGAGSKSIVFHLSATDPNALENLMEINMSGELIQDLAEVLVPADLQEEFVDRWSTELDKEEYQAALSNLKAKVQCDSYDFCIISDDTEWENQLVEGLKQRRPNINCIIMKKWRLSKPETIKLSITESKKVIIGLSPKPYSKYAAHSVVIEMLEAKTLADAKLMPVKISKDAVVPPAFESFTVVNVWEEDFVDKLLQDLNECEKLKLDIPKVSDPKDVEVEKKYMKQSTDIYQKQELEISLEKLKLDIYEGQELEMSLEKLKLDVPKLSDPKDVEVERKYMKQSTDIFQKQELEISLERRKLDISKVSDPKDVEVERKYMKQSTDIYEEQELERSLENYKYRSTFFRKLKRKYMKQSTDIYEEQELEMSLDSDSDSETDPKEVEKNKYLKQSTDIYEEHELEMSLDSDSDSDSETDPKEVEKNKYLKQSTDIYEEHELEMSLGHGAFDFCIISDDGEWESQLVGGLEQRRPAINCTFMKRWRQLLIRQSRNIIFGFSQKPLTVYSKYAEHVTAEMLEAKVMAVKILEDAVVPPAFESCIVLNAWEEDFVDQVLQNLDECEMLKLDIPKLSDSDSETDPKEVEVERKYMKQSTDIHEEHELEMSLGTYSVFWKTICLIKTFIWRLTAESGKLDQKAEAYLRRFYSYERSCNKCDLADDKQIVKAYEQAKHQGKLPCNRCKVLILGDQGTGKTSTCRRLQGNHFRYDEVSTVGIETNTVNANVSDVNSKWREVSSTPLDDYESSAAWWAALYVSKLSKMDIGRESETAKTVSLRTIIDYTIYQSSLTIPIIILYLLGGLNFGFGLAVCAYITCLMPVVDFQSAYCFGCTYAVGMVIIEGAMNTTLHFYEELPDKEVDIFVFIVKLILFYGLFSIVTGFMVAYGGQTGICVALCFMVQPKQIDFPYENLNETIEVIVNKAFQFLFWIFATLSMVMIKHVDVRILELRLMKRVFIVILAALSIVIICCYQGRYSLRLLICIIITIIGVLICIGIVVGRKSVAYEYIPQYYIIKKSIGFIFGITMAKFIGWEFIDLEILTQQSLFDIVLFLASIIVFIVCEYLTYIKVRNTSSVPITHIRQLMHAIICNKSCLDARFSLWDFSGQEMYYNTHDFFMPKQAVFLVLFNAVEAVLNPGKQIKRLQYWLQSVAMHADIENVVVLLVGTRRESVNDTNALLDFSRLAKAHLYIRFSKLLALHPTGELFIYLENASEVDKELNILREVIYNQIKNMKYFQMKFPVKYLLFHEILNRFRHITNLDVILSEAKSTCGIMSQNGLLQLLTSFDRAGDVIYNERDKVLRNYVICDPQILVDILQYLVDVPEPQKRNRRVADLWQILEDRGIVNSRLLEHICQIKGISSTLYPYVIRFLVGIHLLFPAYFTDQIEQVNTFFLSCRLPKITSMSNIWNSNDNSQDIFCFNFGEILPEFIFLRLIAKCCEAFTWDEIYYNAARFRTSESCLFFINTQVISGSNLIKVEVHNEDETQSIGIGLYVLQKMITFTEKIISRDFNPSYFRKRYIYGPVCKKCSSLDGKMRLVNLMTPANNIATLDGYRPDRYHKVSLEPKLTVSCSRC